MKKPLTETLMEKYLLTFDEAEYLTDIIDCSSTVYRKDTSKDLMAILDSLTVDKFGIVVAIDEES